MLEEVVAHYDEVVVLLSAWSFYDEVVVLLSAWSFITELSEIK